MAGRKDAVCFKDFNEALAENPETYGHIDILCGGWPCQDNSIAGSRKGHAGEKSGLFSEFCRVLRVFNPRWFIAENVPGLLSVNAGKDFCEVLAVLQNIGYGISWRILDSKYFGVPQQRLRLFIVGRFGEPCPPEILFECQSDTRDYQKVKEMGKVGLCVSTRDSQRQDPSTENIVAFTLGTDLRGQPWSQEPSLQKKHKCIQEQQEENQILSLTQQQLELKKLAIEYKGILLRRLTPTEKERLQGLPYNWTVPEGLSLVMQSPLISQNGLVKE